MGFIKEGTISGNFPGTEAFAVHYPGYPSSTARAVETLGGNEGILKARGLQSNKLELHFRPEDPYSHPAFGELQPCNNFLLRISKRKDRNGQNTVDSHRVSTCVPEDKIHIGSKSCPQSINSDQVNESQSASTSLSAEVEAQFSQEVRDDLSADIVSRIPEAYYFNGMVDYQHVLAVHADVARRKKRNWADVEPQFEKGGLMDEDQEDLVILVPPLFSIKDVPEKVVLKPSVSLSSKKKQKGVIEHRWEMEIEPCLAIDFYIKEIPKKVPWEKHIPEKSEQWEWQMAVCKLFDERPIWVKKALAERLVDNGVQFGDHTLRRLLFRAAYYFSNGPFLRFWIRKGYDPRKDPESRIYQRIDFRVPPSLRTYDANVATGKHRWEDICSFRVFPYKYQTSLQLFELVDDYIQQEIRKPQQQATCSCATGWFPSSVLDSLRLCVAVRFLSVYPKDGAESLLKSATERFNKSKRMQIYSKDKKLDVEIQPANAEAAELGGNEDKEELDDDGDDEDQEVEIDDDKDEEELDTNEAGEDINFAQDCSYMDSENISKNYLQELFGSFPFGEVGGLGLQDADDSDGEYPIYEQFSEANYSDDDDY